jgi:hypothetical protein
MTENAMTSPSDSRSSKEEFSVLLNRLESAAAEYSQHQGAWEADRLVKARQAVVAPYSAAEPDALRIAAERVRNHACTYGAPADSLLVKREIIGALAQALGGSITDRPSQPPEAGCISIPVDIAKIIDRAFLPNNPNRLRNAHRDTVIAAHRFKDAVRTALTKHPECQHDKSKPGPTLVPLGSAAFGSSDWTWMCTVCNHRFDLPMASASSLGEIHDEG